MASFSQFGNDLYTGAKSIDFIGRRKIWFLVSAIALLLALAVPFLRGGYTFGIEFTGGSEFRISGVETTDQSLATDAVTSVVPEIAPRVSAVGTDAIRVQTDQLADEESSEVRQALADAYSVPLEEVTESFIGPSWGADITGQALRGLLIFLVAVGVFMAFYFRTWKMAVAAMVALLHDLILTAGVYGIVGFEVTPAAVIGFLTILGYSLYDTVVVFDKIRENTLGGEASAGRSFAQAVNLAVNQTLVRSINTSIVAILPVAAILFIGAFLLGAGTLRDIALALFIGILVGTYSTIFVAAPLYSLMREREPEIQKQSKRALELQTKGAV
ncbi:protein translocase subunit SecF [Naasia sp. SYSU D00057]|uniref:protein translocase subunit SecF n=1 Tax=Naasia sp. SYSU D00057 TaxID=2817380 RepID=UPI001B304CCC|nr:protein translocase subunit SecF [Naasia sp. SYSU D00057]